MKLLAFSLIYLSILVSLSGYRISWRAAFWISILYVILLRQGGFQGDFQVYLDELRTGWLSFYYFREPLFWVGSKVLFSYLGSERIVILIYDLLFCYFLCESIKKVSSPNVFFVILVSFPVFLGIENIYRQVLGLPFSLLFFYHCLNRNIFFSLVYLLLASLFHNSYILLSPMLIFCFPNISIGVRFLIVIIFVCIGVFAVSYFGFSVDMVDKSSAQSTGLDLEILYLMVILLTSLIMSIIMINCFRAKWVFLILLINSIFLISAGYLGSAQSERVGMMLLILLFYSYFCFSGYLTKNRNSIVKMQMFFVLSAPVFLFSSTRSFLVAGGY